MTWNNEMVMLNISLKNVFVKSLVLWRFIRETFVCFDCISTINLLLLLHCFLCVHWMKLNVAPNQEEERCSASPSFLRLTWCFVLSGWVCVLLQPYCLITLFCEIPSRSLVCFAFCLCRKRFTDPDLQYILDHIGAKLWLYPGLYISHVRCFLSSLPGILQSSSKYCILTCSQRSFLFG